MEVPHTAVATVQQWCYKTQAPINPNKQQLSFSCGLKEPTVFGKTI
jgi:hypothetical protein